MHLHKAERRHRFYAVVAVRNAVQRIHRYFIKTKLLCLILSVKRKTASGKRTRTNRAYADSFKRVRKPVCITRKHPAPGTQMMCKRYRLGVLHMRKARHYRLCMFFCNLSKRFYKSKNSVLKVWNKTAKVKPFVKRNLVVPASSCMNFFTRFAYPVCKGCFYKRMNILRRIVDFQSAVIQVFFY